MCGCTKPPAQRIVTELETHVGDTSNGCLVYSRPCPVHGFIHGAEAEELREGIEKILAKDGDERGFARCLRALLDRIDARDSVAYLEAKKIEWKKHLEEDNELG